MVNNDSPLSSSTAKFRRAVEKAAKAQQVTSIWPVKLKKVQAVEKKEFTPTKPDWEANNLSYAEQYGHDRIHHLPHRLGAEFAAAKNARRNFNAKHRWMAIGRAINWGAAQNFANEPTGDDHADFANAASILASQMHGTHVLHDEFPHHPLRSTSNRDSDEAFTLDNVGQSIRAQKSREEGWTMDFVEQSIKSQKSKQEGWTMDFLDKTLGQEEKTPEEESAHEERRADRSTARSLEEELRKAATVVDAAELDPAATVPDADVDVAMAIPSQPRRGKSTFTLVIMAALSALSMLLVLLSLLVLLAEYPAIGRAIQLKRTTLTALPAQPMCRWPNPEAHEDVEKDLLHANKVLGTSSWKPHPLCKWPDPEAREGVEKGLLHAKKALMTSWKPLILAAVTVSAIKWFQAVAIPALGTWAGPLAASAVAEILWRVGRGVGAAKRAAEHAVAATKVVA